MTNASSNHRVAVVLAAGGIGSRFSVSKTGSGVSQAPKQCFELKGKPIYMWCLLSFLTNRTVAEIVIVAHRDIQKQINSDLDNQLTAEQRQKVTVIPGGTTRQESVFCGLKHLSHGSKVPDYVLIHDAARPFIKQSLIDTTIDAVIRYGACTVAVPVSDTIKKVEQGCVKETLDRSNLYAVHTPQAGRFDWLLAGHEEAAKKNIAATDDAYILELANHEVKIVEGDKYNIKVTVPEDLQICAALSDMFVSQIMDV